MESATWRQLITVTTLGGLAIGSFFAIRWIWRDITYWSRSTMVAYKNPTLEDCVRVAVTDWPGISASFNGSTISLHGPAQEGVIVKDTETPQVARIVVYGHSASITTLGPASEASVNELLRELSI